MALWAEKLEFPLTIAPCLDMSDSISDWSLPLALESAALVSARFLLGEPSTLRCSVSSYSPLWGSRRCRWTLRPGGTWSRMGRLPSPLTM